MHLKELANFCCFWSKNGRKRPKIAHVFLGFILAQDLAVACCKIHFLTGNLREPGYTTQKDATLLGLKHPNHHPDPECTLLHVLNKLFFCSILEVLFLLRKSVPDPFFEITKPNHAALGVSDGQISVCVYGMEGNHSTPSGFSCRLRCFKPRLWP